MKIRSCDESSSWSLNYSLFIRDILHFGARFVLLIRLLAEAVPARTSSSCQYLGLDVFKLQDPVRQVGLIPMTEIGKAKLPFPTNKTSLKYIKPPDHKWDTKVHGNVTVHMCMCAFVFVRENKKASVLL